jgi:fatty-acyl-CoA synthase
VLRAGAVAELDELVAWCRERLAGYKVPRRVVLVEALPRGATGKVDKKLLRA